MSITNKQQDYRHCHPLLLHIPHFHHHKDGGGLIQIGVDQMDRYACRYSIFYCLLGVIFVPLVSEKIFHCKPNLPKSTNLYSTSCVDNRSCPWTTPFWTNAIWIEVSFGLTPTNQRDNDTSPKGACQKKNDIFWEFVPNGRPPPPPPPFGTSCLQKKF